jgi:hypothetical protein
MVFNRVLPITPEAPPTAVPSALGNATDTIVPKALFDNPLRNYI